MWDLDARSKQKKTQKLEHSKNADNHVTFL